MSETCVFGCHEDGDDWYHALKCPVAKALRGSWSTPGWLADLIGTVGLDPCSNDRSRVDSEWRCSLEAGDDGLPGTREPGWWYRKEDAFGYAGTTARVFVNPPYGPGEVIRWVRHYKHTRFIFLLRWDPSTAWASELLPACTHVWFPDRRIDFIPPPRIRSSTNPFPHGLYLRDPPADLLERLRGAGYLFSVDGGRLTGQSRSWTSTT